MRTVYDYPPMAARIAIPVCLYLFLFAAYRSVLTVGHSPPATVAVARLRSTFCPHSPWSALAAEELEER